MPRLTDTADKILDVAEKLLKERGYNGFSYKEIAGALDIRNASIHFHYPTKADLGVALVRRYTDNFMSELTRIASSTTDANVRLAGIRDLFANTLLNNQQLCLCGMAGAELATLPPDVAAETTRFFTETRHWLAQVLKEGKSAGTLKFPGKPETLALSILSMLEGAMLVARSIGEPEHFRDAVNIYFTALR